MNLVTPPSMNDQKSDSLSTSNNQNERHEFSSTQIQIPDELASKIKEFSAQIPDVELGEDGREDDFHITVRFGLHTDDPEQIANAIYKRASDNHKVAVKFGKLSIFPASADRPTDVLKIGIISPDLHELHNSLGEVEHTDTHPVYTPHATIAYLKPGFAQKYDGQVLTGVSDVIFQVDKIRLSDRDRKVIDIPIAKPISDPMDGYDMFSMFQDIFTKMMDGKSDVLPGTIEVSIEPTTLPDDGKWGLPAGPLPLIVQQKPIPNEQWICPHCNKEIGEKAVYCNIDNGNSYHRDCGGQFVRAVPREEQAFVNSLKNRWGVTEGYFANFHDPNIIERTEKPLPLINRHILVESMAKSVDERIHRRTRIKKKRSKRNITPVIKKTADNDPRRTAVGAASLQGSAKANRDKRKKKCPDQYCESIDFLSRFYKQAMDIVIEGCSGLQDPITLLELLDRLSNDPKLDRRWLGDAKIAISSILESRNYQSLPYFAVSSVQESIAKAETIIREDLKHVRKFFPDAWVGSNDKNQLRQYRIFTQRDSSLVVAESIFD